MTGRMTFGTLLRAALLSAFVLAGTSAASAATADPAPLATDSAYAHLIRTINPHIPAGQSEHLARELLRDAALAHLDARLVAAIVTVESHWQAKAVSRTGARGFGQLMPGTALSLHVDARRPEQNLQGTSRYLARLVQRFGGDSSGLPLAIGAYNAGPGAVSRYGGVPPYAETQRYVKKVLSAFGMIASRVERAVGDASRPGIAEAATPEPFVPTIDPPAIGELTAPEPQLDATALPAVAQTQRRSR